MTHWHEHNAHEGELTYVPMDELAGICAVGTIRKNNMTHLYTKELVLESWATLGDKLDTYVLSQGRRVEACLRYGPQPQQYVRLYVENSAALKRLVAQHRQTERTRQPA